MSKSKHSSIQPKSIRQKQILDIAAKNPGATLGEIADEVPSASTDHVDRTLDRYGDPAADDEEKTADDNEETADDSEKSADDGKKTADDSGKASVSSEEADSSPAEHGSPASNDDSMTAFNPQDDGATGSNQDAESAATDTTDESPATEEADDTPATEPTEQADDTAEPKSPVETGTTGSIADGETESSTAEEDETPIDAGGAESSATEETPPEPTELTQKERETLRAICYDPDATQKQIADMLSVSRATVSNRVNAIRGFDWAEREAFVDEMFDGELVVDSQRDSTPATPGETKEDSGKQVLTNGASGTVSQGSSGVPDPQASPDVASADTASDSGSPVRNGERDSAEPTPTSEEMQIAHEIENVSQRLATIEQEIDETDTGDDGAPFKDAELIHKVVYACMNSERVSEEEELRILEELMN